MRNHNIKSTIFVLLAVILCVAAPAIAQDTLDESGSFSIKTKNGYLFIHNGEKKSLRFEIISKNVEANQATENPSFIIDGRLFQIVTVSRTDFDPTQMTPTSRLLEAHRKWESDYLAEEVFGAIKTESRSEKIAGHDVLLWWFTRPKFDQEFDRDYFATTLFGDNIFGISCPVTKGTDFAEYRKTFDGVFKTLQIQDEPFDVEKIAIEMRDSAESET